MIFGVIQVRMGSKRLPEKAMADIEGKPMIAWVIERAKKSRLVDLWCLATTKRPEDDRLADIANMYDIPVYRGSVDNRVERAYFATLKTIARTMVRITGDCPLIDPKIIDKTIVCFLEKKVDYCSNLKSYPDGLDVEIFSIKTLKRLYDEGDQDWSYLSDHEDEFKIAHLRHNPILKSLKWSVDTKEDLEFVKEAYRNLGNNFDMVGILGFSLLRHIVRWSESDVIVG